MVKPREDITAPIPADLADADSLLFAFGRWAMGRLTRRRCGSAEGAYIAKPDEEDRQPREILMHPFDAMRVQRALARVPAKWRLVLEVLYVPKRANGKPIKPELMFRLLRIPPKLSQERHLEGLRQFANIHRVMVAKSNKDAMIRAPGTKSEIPSSPKAGSRVSAAVEVIA